MKTERLGYFVLGIILVVSNTVATYFNIDEMKKHFSTNILDIGFLLRSHILLIMGLGLVVNAYQIHKKINRKKRDPFSEPTNKL